ncbi:MAG: glycosyltransferase [Caldisericia bacterium]|nr:glycosyltransferase [Caldisericia bacterium]
MIVNTTILTLLLTFIGIYYLFLYLISFVYKRPKINGFKDEYFYFIFIPAKNEEKVIKKTVENFLKFNSNNFRLIILNDNSKDNTRAIVSSFFDKDKRVVLLDRIDLENKIGKGAVLNFGFKQILFMLRHNFLEPLNLSNDFLKKYDYEHIIIGVFDADAKPYSFSLNRISDYFKDFNLDAIQTMIRIYNREKSLLAKMQDIEFIGFSQIIQKGRASLGSVGLGGNGQFAKISSLLKLGETPWGNTLTEDLELGLRLISRGLKLGYADDIITEQEGVENIIGLIKQRGRWLQGHLSNWIYIPKILLSKSSFITKLDSIFYLTFVSTVFLVFLSVSFSFLSFLKIIFVKNEILNYFHNINNFIGFIVLITISFIFIPIFFTGLNNFYKVNIFKKVIFIILFAFYTYIWIPSFFIALFKLIFKITIWVKTERFVIEEYHLPKLEKVYENEKRAYPRINLNFLTLIEDKPAMLLDYSNGGIGILTKYDNFNDEINIKIKELNIEKAGKIVYKLPIENNLYRIGIKFT